MNPSEGYDVLRLIEHGRICYISSEYVEGTTLIKWLKYHPNISKEQLFSWIHSLTRQLECIHKCRGEPCYRYVNPYSVIVTEEKELYFLDMSAKSNEQALSRMTRRSVREHFLPSDQACYETESISLDIYGLGKTIQYLLSVSKLEPELTKREEARFQKIISTSLNRHSGRAYTNLPELRKQIPIYKELKKKPAYRRRFLLAASVLSAALGVNMFLRPPDSFSEQKERAARRESEIPAKEVQLDERKADQEQREETVGLKEELGLLYFLEQKDYAKSRKYFADIKGEPLADKMAELSEYMSAEDVSGRERGLESLLLEIENEVRESISVKEQKRYFLCLLEGYRLLDSVETAEAVLRLCDVSIGDMGEELREEAKQMLTGYMARAYERTGKQREAIESYEAMLTWEAGSATREELYKKLIFLWMEAGEPGQAESVCRQGIEELTDCTELKLVHIRIQCANEAVERETCAQTIQQYIGEMPEIVEQEEFQKLANEYGITVEGEQVWVGR